MDLATITRSLTEIETLTKAGNVKVEKQIADISTHTTKTEARLLDLEQKLAAQRSPGSRQNGGRGDVLAFGELIAKDAKIELLRKREISHARITVPGSLAAICKSVLTSTGTSGNSPEYGFPTPSQFIAPTPANAPGRRLLVLQSLPHQPVSAGTAIIPQISSVSDGAAVQEFQGGAKGESTLAVHPQTLPMATVATYLNASRQLLDDVPGLPTFLQSYLGYFVLRRLENLICSGDGTQSSGHILGLTAAGTAFTANATYNADKIGQAIYEGLPAYGYAASLVIVNSTDFFNIISQRATTEQYVSAGWNAAAPDKLWGVTAVPTPAMPQGTAVVLDAQLVSILDRQEIAYFIGQPGTNFVENLFSYLAEIRSQLAIGDPHAVQVVTLV